MIRIKRTYDPAARDDGKRFLVERLWPRGMKKESLAMDAWLKDVAPSTQLRQWFAHRPERWDEFRRRYERELSANPDALSPIVEASKQGAVTLLYSAHDVEHNGAVVLRDYLMRRRHRSVSRARTPQRVVPSMGSHTAFSCAKGDDDWKRLAVQAPFHLEATVRVLQRRPANLVDVWEQGRYRRVLATTGGLVLLETMDRGVIDRPDVRFIVHGPRISGAMRAEVERTLRRMLGLDLDPRPMQTLALRERELCPTALALRGMRPPRSAGLFETLGNVIPFQQLSVDAGVAIVTRMVEYFGEHLEHDGRRMYAFPSASAIAEARIPRLRACGLSGSKANALRELARTIVAGNLNEEQISSMSTDDALRLLTGLPGIGPWTAALVLLRGFGRLDVFPPGDVGAMRALRALLRLGPAASLDPVHARFGDLRGHLYFFGLGASLLARGLIHSAQADEAPSRPVPTRSVATKSRLEVQRD